MRVHGEMKVAFFLAVCLTGSTAQGGVTLASPPSVPPPSPPSPPSAPPTPASPAPAPMSPPSSPSTALGQSPVIPPSPPGPSPRTAPTLPPASLSLSPSFQAPTELGSFSTHTPAGKGTLTLPATPPSASEAALTPRTPDLEAPQQAASESASASQPPSSAAQSASTPATPPPPPQGSQPACPGGQVSGICGCPFKTDNPNGNLALVAGPVKNPNTCCNDCLSLGPQVCNHWVFCYNPNGPGCGEPGGCSNYISDPTHASIINNSPVPNDSTTFCASDGSWPKLVCYFKNGTTRLQSMGQNGGWTSGGIF